MKLIEYQNRGAEVYYRFTSTFGDVLCEWQFGGHSKEEARGNARGRFGYFLEGQHPIHASSEPYDGGGWAGDGSGANDLADYNQNEAADYANE